MLCVRNKKCLFKFENKQIANFFLLLLFASKVGISYNLSSAYSRFIHLVISLVTYDWNS